jgi:hypothetical protein
MSSSIITSPSPVFENHHLYSSKHFANDSTNTSKKTFPGSSGFHLKKTTISLKENAEEMHQTCFEHGNVVSAYDLINYSYNGGDLSHLNNGGFGNNNQTNPAHSFVPINVGSYHNHHHYQSNYQAFETNANMLRYTERGATISDNLDHDDQYESVDQNVDNEEARDNNYYWSNAAASSHEHRYRAHKSSVETNELSSYATVGYAESHSQATTCLGIGTTLQDGLMTPIQEYEYDLDQSVTS